MSKNKKTNLFSVIIEPCEEGGFFASCPSIQGCYAEGETYSEVLENIEDVANIHVNLIKLIT